MSDGGVCAEQIYPAFVRCHIQRPPFAVGDIGSGNTIRIGIVTVIVRDGEGVTIGGGCGVIRYTGEDIIITPACDIQV